MFDNIGGKIKGLAKVVCAVEIAISVLIAIIIIAVYSSYDPEYAAPAFLVGMVVIGVGTLFSWLSNIILYGYGQLIENSDTLVKNSNTNQKDIEYNTEANTPKKIYRTLDLNDDI